VTWNLNNRIGENRRLKRNFPVERGGAPRQPKQGLLGGLSIMILVNQKDPGLTFRFGLSRWVRLLSIARALSWIPQGTTAPAAWSGEPPWNRLNFTIPVGQTVEEQDAAALAEKIERLMEIIEETKPGTESAFTYRDWYPERQRLWSFYYHIGLREEDNQFLYSNWSRRKLTELVFFCRQGAFLIHQD